MAKRFAGELEDIDPSRLITEGRFDRMESFFLGLGLIFNDFKGLILFEELVIDSYDKPKPSDLDDHSGNYAGVMVQIHRLFAGVVSGFFEFVQKNEKVYNTPEFKEILSKVSSGVKHQWESLKAAAFEEWGEAEKLLSTSSAIRNHVAFHVDPSGQGLREGYISHFFGNTKHGRSAKAFYSAVTGNKPLSRFYFSDAAAEEALRLAAGKESKDDIETDTEFKSYQRQVVEAVQIISDTALSLVKAYIQYRRNQSDA